MKTARVGSGRTVMTAAPPSGSTLPSHAGGGRAYSGRHAGEGIPAPAASRPFLERKS